MLTLRVVSMKQHSKVQRSMASLKPRKYCSSTVRILWSMAENLGLQWRRQKSKNTGTFSIILKDIFGGISMASNSRNSVVPWFLEPSNPWLAIKDSLYAGIVRVYYDAFQISITHSDQA